MARRLITGTHPVSSWSIRDSATLAAFVVALGLIAGAILSLHPS